LLGLLPASASQRQTLWRQIAEDPYTVVCECWPDALEDILNEISALLGDRRAVIFGATAIGGDDVWRGRVNEFLALLAADRPTLSDEVVLVLEGAIQDADWSEEEVRAEVQAELAAGASLRDAAREVSRHSGWSKRQVYRVAVQMEKEDDRASF
jgi:16S rRNA (cytidine1402-2'-O)-methyltransferase